MQIANPLLRLLAALAIVVGVSAVPVARVAACDCALMGPDEAAAAADAVFTGAAVAAAEGPMPAQRDDPMPMPMSQVVYTFAVDGVAKGDVGAEAQVLAGGDQGACGMSFAIGERWLIFATAEGGMLTTHLCSGNIALKAGEEPPIPVSAPTASAATQSGGGVPIGVLLPLAAVVALGGVSAYLFWRAERPS